MEGEEKPSFSVAEQRSPPSVGPSNPTSQLGAGSGDRIGPWTAGQENVFLDATAPSHRQAGWQLRRRRLGGGLLWPPSVPHTLDTHRRARAQFHAPFPRTECEARARTKTAPSCPSCTGVSQGCGTVFRIHTVLRNYCGFLNSSFLGASHSATAIR